MALIKCPECGKEISDKAPACIHCGYPLALELNKSNENTESTVQQISAVTSTANSDGLAQDKKYRLTLKTVGSNASAIRSAFEKIEKDYDTAIANLPYILQDEASADDSEKIIELFKAAGCKVIAEDSSEIEEALDSDLKYDLIIQEHASNRAFVANMLIGLRDFDFDTAFTFAGKDNYKILRKAKLSEVEKMADKLLYAGAKLQLIDENGVEHKIPSKWQSSTNDVPPISNYHNTSSNNYTQPHYSSDPKVAKCPKCGSTSIQVVKKGFGLGKAAAGALLIGPVGLLGGAIGSNKTVRVCLNCNHKW